MGENILPKSRARDWNRKRSAPVKEQEEDAYVEVYDSPVDLKRLKFDVAANKATGHGDPTDAREVTEQDNDMEQGESVAWEGTTEPEYDGEAEED